MKRKNAVFVFVGALCLVVGVALAYVTDDLGSRPLHHSIAALINITGLWLIWYGIHKAYWERMLKRCIAELEDTNPGIDKTPTT